ncbi:Sir2 family NAD-dependent protein deacetylase [Sphingomonas sp. 3-13AW]|uniref:Sir2 family NAD-dependent protein deacetylase n=1 Tax=Sphingomonas sp. 3-13AW TaxID=3050450 RepID=UPI003BB522E9
MTNIMILTGAGISAESGLSTFRDTEGLWENHAVEAVCSAEGSATNPYPVHAFYDARRGQLPLVSPNPAHVALAELEAAWIDEQRGQFTLVTQNVDDLHERGGSRDVLHIHGELASALCISCGARFPWKRDLLVAQDCPVCDDGALRPDVVLFGEATCGFSEQCRTMWDGVMAEREAVTLT